MEVWRWLSTGRIVAAHAAAVGGALKIASSDDGGITWTDRVNVASVGTTDVDVAFDASSGAWCVVCGAPATGGRVFTSSDGATWAQVATFGGTSYLRGVAAVSGLWVGVSVQAARGVHWSVDGVSWKRAGYALGTSSGIASGNGGLLAIDGDRTHTSLKVGAPNLGVLT
jgi:hypothetical protein